METQAQDTKTQFGTKTSKILENIARSECDCNTSENGNLRDLLSVLERIRQTGITTELYSQLDILTQNNLRLKNNCDIALHLNQLKSQIHSTTQTN